MIIIKIIKKIFVRCKSYIEFINEFIVFKKLSDQRFEISWKKRFPCLSDRTQTTGFDPHYIYHTAWAARVLKKINPACHTDISSFLYFNTIVSAFIPINFYDYRPANINLKGLECDKADISKLQFSDNTIESISCMHVVEHIGLGRYGDPIDPKGDLKAVSEIIRVTAKGGNILFVVPIGKPAIEFNAHRIYSYNQVVEMFGGCNLIEFSIIPNDIGGGIIDNPDLKIVDTMEYACGCFWFRKK